MQDTVYLLCRVEDDSSISMVSEHADLVEGIAEGRRVVSEDDFDFAYSLLTDDGCKVATFAEGRIGYREWAMRRSYIHSLDDRYDKDVEELRVSYSKTQGQHHNLVLVFSYAVR